MAPNVGLTRAHPVGRYATQRWQSSDSIMILQRWASGSNEPLALGRYGVEPHDFIVAPNMGPTGLPVDCHNEPRSGEQGEQFFCL